MCGDDYLEKLGKFAQAKVAKSAKESIRRQRKKSETRKS